MYDTGFDTDQPEAVSERAKALLEQTKNQVRSAKGVETSNFTYNDNQSRQRVTVTTSKVTLPQELPLSDPRDEPHVITLETSTPEKKLGIQKDTTTTVRLRRRGMEVDTSDSWHIDQGVEWKIEKRFLRPDKVTVTGWDNKKGTKTMYADSNTPAYRYKDLKGINQIETLAKAITARLPMPVK